LTHTVQNIMSFKSRLESLKVIDNDEMTPFDRSYMTSYLTMALFCTVL